MPKSKSSIVALKVTTPACFERCEECGPIRRRWCKEIERCGVVWIEEGELQNTTSSAIGRLEINRAQFLSTKIGGINRSWIGLEKENRNEWRDVDTWLREFLWVERRKRRCLGRGGFYIFSMPFRWSWKSGINTSVVFLIPRERNSKRTFATLVRTKWIDKEIFYKYKW